jgi:hypothetical protein
MFALRRSPTSVAMPPSVTTSGRSGQRWPKSARIGQSPPARMIEALPEERREVGHRRYDDLTANGMTEAA